MTAAPSTPTEEYVHLGLRRDVDTDIAETGCGLQIDPESMGTRTVDGHRVGLGRVWAGAVLTGFACPQCRWRELAFARSVLEEAHERSQAQPVWSVTYEVLDLGETQAPEGRYGLQTRMVDVVASVDPLIRRLPSVDAAVHSASVHMLKLAEYLRAGWAAPGRYR